MPQNDHQRKTEHIHIFICTHHANVASQTVYMNLPAFQKKQKRRTATEQLFNNTKRTHRCVPGSQVPAHASSAAPANASATANLGCESHSRQPPRLNQRGHRLRWSRGHVLIGRTIYAVYFTTTRIRKAKGAARVYELIYSCKNR